MWYSDAEPRHGWHQDSLPKCRQPMDVKWEWDYAHTWRLQYMLYAYIHMYCTVHAKHSLQTMWPLFVFMYLNSLSPMYTDTSHTVWNKGGDQGEVHFKYLSVPCSREASDDIAIKNCFTDRQQLWNCPVTSTETISKQWGNYSNKIVIPSPLMWVHCVWHVGEYLQDQIQLSPLDA